MRHSLLQIIFSEDGYKPLGFSCMLIAAVLWPAKKATWSSYVWLPIFTLSVLLSLPALIGCVAGGYGGFIVLTFWPFPVAAILLWFARPEHAVSARAVRGVIGAVAVAFLLGFIQRPGPIDIKLQLVDSSGRGIPQARIPCFVYGGAGANKDFTIHTDASGFATLRAYWPEAGSIKVGTGRAQRSIRFQTASPRGGYVVDENDARIGASPDVVVITLKKEEEPNKAPEPTTRSVTPRATESKSK